MFDVQEVVGVPFRLLAQNRVLRKHKENYNHHSQQHQMDDGNIHNHELDASFLIFIINHLLHHEFLIRQEILNRVHNKENVLITAQNISISFGSINRILRFYNKVSIIISIKVNFINNPSWNY